uniref:Uncharacterized protein n=1 Tax=Rhizophora mucronata TaxID=61149 RepID=A0A2P2Q6C0_RHIMU
MSLKLIIIKLLKSSFLLPFSNGKVKFNFLHNEGEYSTKGEIKCTSLLEIQ